MENYISPEDLRKDMLNIEADLQLNISLKKHKNTIERNLNFLDEFIPMLKLPEHLELKETMSEIREAFLHFQYQMNKIH